MRHVNEREEPTAKFVTGEPVEMRPNRLKFKELIHGPHQKPRQLQSPKTSVQRILWKYMDGISVGWSYIYSVKPL